MKYLKIKSNKGFSLIELMVAVSIFAIVMTISMGAVLSIVNGNRKNQSLSVAMNNLNYAVENMTRLMKTGQNFSSIGGSSCDSGVGSETVTFTTTDGAIVAYAPKIVSGVKRLAYYPDYSGASQFEYVTSPEINIDKLCFTIVGTAVGDYLQPSVKIVISGVVTSRDNTSSDFNIHTSVTQRSVQY